VAACARHKTTVSEKRLGDISASGCSVATAVRAKQNNANKWQLNLEMISRRHETRFVVDYIKLSIIIILIA